MKNYLTPTGNLFGSNGWLSDFDGLFSPFFAGESNVLKTDVKEYATHYLLEVEVPGISKNDIDISVDGGYLTVSSTKTDKNDGTTGDWKYVKRERSVSATRTFYIGDTAETEIKATYTDGLLYINVPKPAASSAAAATKRIEIH